MTCKTFLGETTERAVPSSCCSHQDSHDQGLPPIQRCLRCFEPESLSRALNTGKERGGRRGDSCGEDRPFGVFHNREPTAGGGGTALQTNLLHDGLGPTNHRAQCPAGPLPRALSRPAARGVFDAIPIGRWVTECEIRSSGILSSDWNDHRRWELRYFEPNTQEWTLPFACWSVYPVHSKSYVYPVALSHRGFRTKKCHLPPLLSCFRLSI